MTETKDTQFDALFNAVLDIMPRRDEDFADHAEWFAKELFDRGVIVLPCKVGNTVYQHDDERIYETRVKDIIFDTPTIAFNIHAVGKTVFLTREEAEAALNRRADNGSSD